MGGGGGGGTIMSLIHCHGDSISDDDDCCNEGFHVIFTPGRKLSPFAEGSSTEVSSKAGQIFEDVMTANILLINIPRQRTINEAFMCLDIVLER